MTACAYQAWTPFDGLVLPLTTRAPETTTRLAGLMLGLAAAITDHGEERWGRLLAWEKLDIGVSLVRHEPGVDQDPTAPKPTLSSVDERDRADERRASGYAQDVRTTARHLAHLLEQHSNDHAVHNAVVRLRFLIAVAEARTPRQLKSREILAAQAATDGWCRSCFRVGIFNPIGLRPTGQPYYRDLCRWCGENKAGQDQPTIHMLRVHHRLPVRASA